MLLYIYVALSENNGFHSSFAVGLLHTAVHGNQVCRSLYNLDVPS